MFLQFGNKFINTSQIKCIRPFEKKDDAGQWAQIEMLDGETFEGLLSVEKAEALTRQYFPAPAGFENLDFDFAENPIKLMRETVVAFAYEPGADLLIPITAEGGLI
jgi:hypothetical protein